MTVRRDPARRDPIHRVLSDNIAEFPIERMNAVTTATSRNCVPMRFRILRSVRGAQPDSANQTWQSQVERLESRRLRLPI